MNFSDDGHLCRDCVSATLTSRLSIVTNISSLCECRILVVSKPWKRLLLTSWEVRSSPDAIFRQHVKYPIPISIPTHIVRHCTYSVLHLRCWTSGHLDEKVVIKLSHNLMTMLDPQRLHAMPNKRTTLKNPEIGQCTEISDEKKSCEALQSGEK